MFRNAANKLLRSVSVTRTSASTLTIKMPKSCATTWASFSSRFFPREHVQPFHLRSMSTEGKTEKVEKVDMENSMTEEVTKETAEKPQIGAADASVSSGTPAVKVPEFIENETVIEPDGTESLVVYEVDDDFINKTLSEIRISAMNAAISVPVIGYAAYNMSTMTTILGVFVAVLGIRGVLRVISLASMPTRVTVAWPANKTFVSTSLRDTLNLDSVDEAPEVSLGELAYRSEFSQMREHNEAEAVTEKATQDPDAQRTKALHDAQREMAAAQSLSRGFQENPMFPSMLFEKVNFREMIQSWRKLEDPDFPEVVYIERLGFGKAESSKIPTKATLDEIKSLWFNKTVPDVLPFLSHSVVARLQDKPFDTMRLALVAQNTGTVFFGKYVRNVDAFNQLVFAANLNSRKMALTSMAGTRK